MDSAQHFPTHDQLQLVDRVGSEEVPAPRIRNNNCLANHMGNRMSTVAFFVTLSPYLSPRNRVIVPSRQQSCWISAKVALDPPSRPVLGPGPSLRTVPSDQLSGELHAPDEEGGVRGGRQGSSPSSCHVDRRSRAWIPRSLPRKGSGLQRDSVCLEPALGTMRHICAQARHPPPATCPQLLRGCTPCPD